MRDDIIFLGDEVILANGKHANTYDRRVRYPFG